MDVEFILHSLSKALAPWAGTFLILFAAWTTHVAHAAFHAQWILLMTGIVVFPIGIINGIGCWIGLW